jgi:hypothetical protein
MKLLCAASEVALLHTFAALAALPALHTCFTLCILHLLIRHGLKCTCLCALGLQHSTAWHSIIRQGTAQPTASQDATPTTWKLLNMLDAMVLILIHGHFTSRREASSNHTEHKARRTL